MIMNKTQACIQWIKEYFKDNPDGKAIIGISGGKDSTIAAALCVEALGADRVIGVLMPNGKQKDISDSYEICGYLGIQSYEININQAYEGLIAGVAIGIDKGFAPLEETFAFVDNNPMVKTNLPARLRMTTLYAVAAFYPNSRVVNTCNRSEDYVGYSTKYGDAAGDFSPLGNLTVREVLEIGDELGLPERLVHKAPSDGMCGKTDEDNLGFTYEQLDDHILGTAAVDEEVVEKIQRLHKVTRHKYKPMPMFDPYLEKTIALGKPAYDINQLTIDDYANGGLITPEFNAAVMSGNVIMTGLDIAEPTVANNVSINTDYKLEDAIKSIENSIWQSMIKDGIRGI